MVHVQVFPVTKRLRRSAFGGEMGPAKHAFFTALREGRQTSPGPQDALETFRLALAAAKSAGKSPGTDLGDTSMKRDLLYLNATECVVRKSTPS